MPQLVGSGLAIQDEPDTLTVFSRGVKVSFFGTGFDAVAEPDLTSDGVILVASPVDLLAHKLKVILQPAQAKDYLDISALLDAGVPLSAGLDGARHLFGEAFQPSEALKALTYFDDVPDLPQTNRQQLQASAVQVLGDRSFDHDNDTEREDGIHRMDAHIVANEETVKAADDPHMLAFRP